MIGNGIVGFGESDHLPNPEFFGMECISFQTLSSIKFPMFTFHQI